MIEATALTYAAVRSSIPDALLSGETTWIISVPATVGGMQWNMILGTIFAPHITRERTICFEEIGRKGDRVFVLIGVRRR